MGMCVSPALHRRTDLLVLCTPLFPDDTPHRLLEPFVKEGVKKVAAGEFLFAALKYERMRMYVGGCRGEVGRGMCVLRVCGGEVGGRWWWEGWGVGGWVAKSWVGRWVGGSR